jgi:hypothetical protein
MRQIVFTFALVLASGLAMLAQDTGSSSQQSGAQGTNPTAGSSSTASPSSSGPESGSMGSQSSTSGSMGQSSSSTASTKGEKKLKGCIESQGGQYTLQEKKGKQVKLTGSADLASHVGHQVTVHGTYAGSGSGAAGNSGADKMPSSSGSTSANPSSSSSGGEQEFMVTKIDHESDTCKIKGASSGKSGMSGSNNSGTQAPDHQ